MKIRLLILLTGLLCWGAQAIGQCSAYFMVTGGNNSAFSVTAAFDPALTYTWSLYNGGGTITSNQNLATIVATPGAAPTVQLTVTGPGCHSFYALTFWGSYGQGNIPPIPAIGPTSVCGGGLRSYKSFYNEGGGTASTYIIGARVIGGTLVGSGDSPWPDHNVEAQFVVDWDSVGTGAIITAFGHPGLNSQISHCTTYVSLNCRVTGPQMVCIGDTSTYRQYCQPGATYAWSTHNGAILSGQSTNQIQVAWTVPGLDTVMTIYNSTACGLDTSYYPIIVSTYPTNTIQGDTIACGRSIDTLTTSSLPTLFYPYIQNRWGVNGGGLSSVTWNQNPFVYRHFNGAVDTIMLSTYDHGCVTHDTFYVNLHPSPTPAIPTQPVICTGDSLLLDAGPGYYNYIWSTGATASAIYASTAPSYTISVTEPLHNCVGWATSTPFVDPDCVWPGDADHDHVVDLNDFLAIGVAFGDTGAARPNALNAWQGQPAPDWINSYLSGENHKHADSDGNGVVDFQDTLSVSLHQGLTHLKIGSITGRLPLYFTPSSRLFAGQDSVELIVRLGDAAISVDSAYGLTFQIGYFTSDVYPGLSGSATNSFLGHPSGPLMHTSAEDANAGRFGWAMVRNDHQPAAGQGEVCRIKLKAKPALWTGQAHVQLPLRVSACRLIDPRGFEIPVTPLMDSVWLYDLNFVAASEPESSQTIQVFPNPAADDVQIRLPRHLSGACTLTMTDGAGREVLSETHRLRTSGQWQQLSLDVHHLPSGVYALRISTARESFSQRLAVLR